MRSIVSHPNDQNGHRSSNRRTSPLADRAYTRAHHAVQFYRDDTFLTKVVAEFLAEGIAQGDRVLTIATNAHRDLIWGQLGELGVDVVYAASSGQLAAVDAYHTLSTFMVDGTINRDRFRATTQLLIQRNRQDREHSRLRMYGEMVDLLWQQGDLEGVLRLEELWNELAETYTFSLLCGYQEGKFHDVTHIKKFLAVCKLHHRVLPAQESVATPDVTTPDVTTPTAAPQ